jgi:hypothetical protein
MSVGNAPFARLDSPTRMASREPTSYVTY